jgi:hypothetical protein
MAQTKRKSKSDDLLEALLTGATLGRPVARRSPFAGARPKVVKAAPSQPQIGAPTPPIDTSGFAGLGSMGGGGGKEPVGSDAWALRQGGPGALLARAIYSDPYGAMGAVNKLRRKGKA